MTTHPILPSRNEDYGFFRTLTVCPERDRRSAEVWMLASRLIAEAIGASSEDEMIGIRDFLDSRIGRHFADDVVGNMTGCNIGLEPAIASILGLLILGEMLGLVDWLAVAVVSAASIGATLFKAQKAQPAE